jgi:hypothetical protein
LVAVIDHRDKPTASCTLVHGTWMYAKGFRHLIKGQHPLVAETVKARFESIGDADLGDDKDSELGPKGWLIAASVEYASDLCVSVVLHESVNLTHDSWIELGEFGHGLRVGNGEALGPATTKADIEADLILLEEGHILNEESHHAFAQLFGGLWIVEESGKVSG